MAHATRVLLAEILALLKVEMDAGIRPFRPDMNERVNWSIATNPLHFRDRYPRLFCSDADETPGSSNLLPAQSLECTTKSAHHERRSRRARGHREMV